MHGGAETALRALGPLVLHLLDLLLVLELIEVVVRAADLVSMRGISWYAARSFFFALGI